MSIADIVIEVFAMQSGLLRSRKFAPAKRTSPMRGLLRDALAR
jgi:hypothetical protein